MKSANFENPVVNYFHQYCKYIDTPVMASWQGWLDLVNDFQLLIAFIVTGQTLELLETIFISEKTQVQARLSDYVVNMVSLISFT